MPDGRGRGTYVTGIALRHRRHHHEPRRRKKPRPPHAETACLACPRRETVGRAGRGGYSSIGSRCRLLLLVVVGEGGGGGGRRDTPRYHALQWRLVLAQIRGGRWCVNERVRSQLAREKAAAFRRPRRVAAAAVPEAAPPIRRRLRPRFYTPRARRRGGDDALHGDVPVLLRNEQVTIS